MDISLLLICPSGLCTPPKSNLNIKKLKIGLPSYMQRPKWVDENSTVFFRYAVVRQKCFCYCTFLENSRLSFTYCTYTAFSLAITVCSTKRVCCPCSVPTPLFGGQQCVVLLLHAAASGGHPTLLLSAAVCVTKCRRIAHYCQIFMTFPMHKCSKMSHFMKFLGFSCLFLDSF